MKAAKAKATPTWITISDRTWRSQQSWYREQITIERGNKLRFSVRLDVYTFQSNATVELWCGTGWSEVHRIAGEELAVTPSTGMTSLPREAPDFEPDIDELRRVAGMIVTGGAA